MRFYERNQIRLYNKFCESFKDNADALDVIDAIDPDDVIDCGSKVVPANNEWLTRG